MLTWRRSTLSTRQAGKIGIEIEYSDEIDPKDTNFDKLLKIFNEIRKMCPTQLYSLTGRY